MVTWRRFLSLRPLCPGLMGERLAFSRSTSSDSPPRFSAFASSSHLPLSSLLLPLFPCSVFSPPSLPLSGIAWRLRRVGTLCAMNQSGEALQPLQQRRFPAAGRPRLLGAPLRTKPLPQLVQTEPRGVRAPVQAMTNWLESPTAKLWLIVAEELDGAGPLVSLGRFLLA